VALREPFSLINSEFNAFLFAPIGEEGNGMTLTVMSALTRLDIDPWREAARLSELSKERAVDALAPTIGRLSGGRWAFADTREIAARLVVFLPRRDAVGPSHATAVGGSANPNPRTTFLMISVAVLSALLFSAVLRHQWLPSRDGAPTETSGPDSRP
jgi:hypothetical protein